MYRAGLMPVCPPVIYTFQMHRTMVRTLLLLDKLIDPIIRTIHCILRHTSF